MINFMKYRWLYFGISLLVIGPGVVSLLTHGLKLGVDFTGGTLWEIRIANRSNLNLSEATGALQPIWEPEVIQPSGLNQFVLRGKTLAPDQHAGAVTALTQAFGQIEEVRFTTVGPVLGAELLRKTLIGILIAVTGITLYVWRQFKQLSFGICAILAVWHDVLVMLGVFSLLGWWRGVEVDVLFVTALLTTLSFSIHDTIVVYDRVRELTRHYPRLSLPEILNIAVLQTLGRSLNNSMTIIMMLVALVLLGGDSIRLFGLALLVGAITGTYSSTFTAAPLLLVWHEMAHRRSSRVRRTASV